MESSNLTYFCLRRRRANFGEGLRPAACACVPPLRKRRSAQGPASRRPSTPRSRTAARAAARAARKVAMASCLGARGCRAVGVRLARGARGGCRGEGQIRGGRPECGRCTTRQVRAKYYDLSRGGERRVGPRAAALLGSSGGWAARRNTQCHRPRMRAPASVIAPLIRRRRKSLAAR